MKRAIVAALVAFSLPAAAWSTTGPTSEAPSGFVGTMQTDDSLTTTNEESSSIAVGSTTAGFVGTMSTMDTLVAGDCCAEAMANGCGRVELSCPTLCFCGVSP